MQRRVAVVADETCQQLQEAAGLATRLREAREYIGLGRERAAEALGCSLLLVESLENGGAEPGPEMLERLGRIYMRPVAWFRDESGFTPSPELLRQVERLTPHDREAMLDFAEFLQGAGPALRDARKGGRRG